MEYIKICVGMTVNFYKDGGMRPLEVCLEDGQRIQIDRVKHLDKALPKTGGLAVRRYTVSIGGLIRYLYYDAKNLQWFVEKKNENYSSQRFE